MADQLLQALRGAIGSPHVLTPETHDLSAHEIDWRRRYHGRARAVVRPGNTAEVAAVVRQVAAHGASVVPQGGSTGLVGGGVPDASGTQIVLDLRRLNRIRAVDTANATLTAEAGCTLQAVQEAAKAQGRLFPLSLGSEGLCTLGGTLATNAGGTQVLRYGNARELCLGLEAVTAQGEVWDGLRGLRKDNTGYALRDLLIGSEGTLAILTAATMKLYPLPAAQRTALAACASLADAVALLDLARQHAGDGLTGFEVMDAASAALVAQHQPALAAPLRAPWLVLLALSDAVGDDHVQQVMERLLATALAAGCIRDAVIAASVSQSQRLWALREGIPLAQAAQGLNAKHDVSLPVSRLAAFEQEARARLCARWADTQILCFGHAGDGNLHYNVQPPPDMSPADFLHERAEAIHAIVHELAVQMGGSFSAEHGVGQLKRAEMAALKSPVALRMMRAIKAALDPQGVLNPGRVLPD